MKLPLKITRNDESFGIRDAAGTSIAYVYFDEEPGTRRDVRKRLSLEEAEAIAKHIARSLTDAEKARAAPKDSAG